LSRKREFLTVQPMSLKGLCPVAAALNTPGPAEGSFFVRSAEESRTAGVQE